MFFVTEGIGYQRNTIYIFSGASEYVICSWCELTTKMLMLLIGCQK